MTVRIAITGLEQTEGYLAQLPIAIRGKRLQAGLRKALNMVKKRAAQLIPPPGYPGDKPGQMPLRETLRVAIREYPSGNIVGIVGPKWPEGAHGHIVEGGAKPHEIRTKTGITYQHPGAEPHPYLMPAVQDSLSQMGPIVIEHLKRAVRKQQQ